MEKKFVSPIGEELYIVNTGDWRAQRPVIDQERCNQCGICLLFCPTNMVRRTDGKFWIDMSYCKGCAICENECPRKAITMVDEGSVA